MTRPATGVDTEVEGMEPIFELRIADRCDVGRCGAQARVITLHNNGPLLWCAHHYAKHEGILAPRKVLDERDKINTSPSISASR